MTNNYKIVFVFIIYSKFMLKSSIDPDNIHQADRKT